MADVTDYISNVATALASLMPDGMSEEEETAWPWAYITIAQEGEITEAIEIADKAVVLAKAMIAKGWKSPE